MDQGKIGFLAASLAVFVTATAQVQTYYRPPKVKEFKSVGEDMGKFTMWWRNRLLRIFLAYLLPGLGSMIGSVVGAGKIFSELF